jgi:hypothetical protein
MVFGYSELSGVAYITIVLQRRVDKEKSGACGAES